MLTTLPNRVSALFADPLHTVLRELDRDLTWNGNGPNCQSRKVAPMSMWSDNNSVFIELDVPGISISELQVSVENGK
ncbi:MAG: Hsp20/alpha crystallin family protein, partial [Planctomycetes bacterium]|nr:Hsp20/alpha crystallin family protein [Planctomycetota bacterium]